MGWLKKKKTLPEQLGEVAEGVQALKDGDCGLGICMAAAVGALTRPGMVTSVVLGVRDINQKVADEGLPVSWDGYRGNEEKQKELKLVHSENVPILARRRSGLCLPLARVEEPIVLSGRNSYLLIRNNRKKGATCDHEIAIIGGDRFPTATADVLRDQNSIVVVNSGGKNTRPENMVTVEDKSLLQEKLNDQIVNGEITLYRVIKK